MQLEWIHCLSGRHGSISAFPAEMLAEKGAPGVAFRRSGAGIKISPDFRAKNISVDGKPTLASVYLEPGVPAFLRMGKILLALCVTDGENNTWAAHYRFPLWTLFEPETFEPIATVRTPAEIARTLKNKKLRPEDCLAAPYGLTMTIPLPQIFDLL